MQAHGPAISNAYFAKPLQESLSLKQKKIVGFPKANLNWCNWKGQKLDKNVHRIPKTSYLLSLNKLSFLAPKKRRKGFEGMCVTPRKSSAQGLRLLSVSPRILEWHSSASPAPPDGCKWFKEQICLPVSFTLLGVGVKHNNPHLPSKLLLQGLCLCSSSGKAHVVQSRLCRLGCCTSYSTVKILLLTLKNTTDSLLGRGWSDTYII